MGLDAHAIRFLLVTQANGVCFNKILTIGRQQIGISLKSLREELLRFYIRKDDEEIRKVLQDQYAEPLLKLFGAKEVHSLDASSYENASLIHNMNTPIAENLKESFTVVIDGGSLEHIFNFPQAIKNCMEMVQTGGHFLAITPANNLMGHGFYQFSPELYFRIFTAENGFHMERVFIYEVTKEKWYRVIDPEKIQRRVMLINKTPTYLLIQAKKTARVPIFASPPEQSDYVTLWRGDSPQAEKAKNIVIGKTRKEKVVVGIKKIIPKFIKDIYRLCFPRYFFPEFFQEIDIADLASTQRRK